MVAIAETMDIARFRKEALYSSKKMGRRLSAKEETLLNLDNQADAPKNCLAPQGRPGQGTVRRTIGERTEIAAWGNAHRSQPLAR